MVNASIPRIFGDYVLRKATNVEEYKMVAQLHVSDGDENDGEKLLKTIKLCSKMHEYFLLIAVKEDTIVASAELMTGYPMGNNKSKDTSYFTGLIVAKTERRKGLASVLIDLAEDLSTVEKMKKLFLHVKTENKAAWQLYLKKDFKIVQEEANKTDELILMGKDLM